ncbi:telomere-binding alpha subunit central domain-containing protein [Stagonosporopsis vannaccii]|nr:telomere-binding alpha subunit central domain-containing protein [Stagonosporopsis vannaccii]
MSGLPGFTAVRDAKNEGALVNLLGVVVSVQDPRKTKGTDWKVDFTIQDDFSASAVGGSSSMGCRVFRPSEASLPKIKGAGDIVILRNFKLNAWQGRMDCVSNPRSDILVFHADKIPVPELSQAYLLGTQRLPYHTLAGAREPTSAEQKAVLVLKHSSSGSAQDVRQYASTALLNPTTRRKEALIKDLTFNQFYDIDVQVLTLYYTNYGTVDLKVTDYTANKELYMYADPDHEPDMVFKREWPGPYGQVTLQVRLYEPHATWARENLTKGDFVHLRNVHTKLSPANFLEGVIHADRQMPNQIDVRKISHSSVTEEIDKRRETYEQQRSNRGTVHLVNAPRKSSAKVSAKKKAEKRDRQRQAKAAELKEIEEKQEKWEVARSGINPNILAAFTEKQRSTISEILNNPHLQKMTVTKYNPFTLPFVNCRHRSRVRVVDFFPPELEYFTYSNKARWEWGFVLLLEDANVPRDTVPQQLRVIVNNDAAQHLGLPHAIDLKAEPRILAQLKELLFILWGNLAELKDELRARSLDLPLPPGDNRLDNRPFDCIIEEYGHEVPVTEENPTGYQRLHKLALTTIRS